MQEVPEVGCEKCGSNLLRPDTTPLDNRANPTPINSCGECGHYNQAPFRFCFYWPASLQAFVLAKWPGIDMKSFRLDPVQFVEAQLNPWLKQRNEGKVIIEGPDNSRHLHWLRSASMTD